MLIKARFRFSELVFGMLLAVAIFALGAAISSSRYQPRQEITKPTTGKGEDTESYWGAIWNWATHDAAGFFTFALVGIGVIQIGVFIRQLRLIRDGLIPARKAAEAATQNAQAVMDAEGAHIYPVIHSHNMREVFQGPILHPTWPDKDPLPVPKVIYSLKNLGKTPAIIDRVMHGVAFYPKPSKDRVLHVEERALEILAADQESDEIACTLSETFTFGKAKAVRNYQGELMFFGEVFFRDFFGRRFQCFWEFEGRPRTWKLARVQQRPDPDAKT